MKYTFVFYVLFLFSCVSSKNDGEQKVDQTAKNQSQITKDSIEISQSNEYKRLVSFLNWYKNGHEELYLPIVEKETGSGESYYAYIDTSIAQQLLNRYRKSGYFTEYYIQQDSLYIEEAKKAYQPRDLEIYDYFDHDFILQTQEIEETLNEIPELTILPKQSNLKKGEIAVSIGGSQHLCYVFIKEKGELKLNAIK